MPLPAATGYRRLLAWNEGMEKRMETNSQSGFGVRGREPRDMKDICMALYTRNGKNMETTDQCLRLRVWGGENQITWKLGV